MFTQGTLGLTFEDVQCSGLITVTSTVASCKPAMLMLCYGLTGLQHRYDTWVMATLVDMMNSQMLMGHFQ